MTEIVLELRLPPKLITPLPTNEPAWNVWLAELKKLNVPNADTFITCSEKFPALNTAELMMESVPLYITISPRYKELLDSAKFGFVNFSLEKRLRLPTLIDPIDELFSIILRVSDPDEPISPVLLDPPAALILPKILITPPLSSMLPALPPV